MYLLHLLYPTVTIMCPIWCDYKKEEGVLTYTGLCMNKKTNFFHDKLLRYGWQGKGGVSCRSYHELHHYIHSIIALCYWRV